MSNLVAFTSSDLANLDSFAQEASSSKTYLKFSKGEWMAGMEQAVIEDDEQFAVNMMELRKGFICWKDGAVAGEEMRPMIGSTPVRKAELEEIEDSDGWQEQTSVVLRSLDTGEEFEFKTSSHGGRSALAALVKEFTDRARRGESDVVPVVCLKTDSYKHKAYGKIYKPLFEIQTWLGASAEVVEREPGSDDDIPFTQEEVEASDAKPKRRSRLTA
ncbi:MAG: hypothetical protein H7842_02465 [Gammaproteobacteria bacterium SHHR-1]